MKPAFGDVRTAEIGWPVAGVGCGVVAVIAFVIAIFGQTPELDDRTLVMQGCLAQDESVLPTAANVPASNRRAIVVIGDSFTAGSPEGGIGARGWPALVRSRLKDRGWSLTTTVDAIGGSGYASPGPSGVTFVDEVSRSVTAADDLVIMFGSSNDIGIPSDEVGSAARRAVQIIRSRAPSAMVIMVGPLWPGLQPSEAVVSVNEVLRKVAMSEGVQYVDAIGEQWLAYGAEFIGSDGVHPTDAGHRCLAGYLGEVIGSALASEQR